MFEGRVPVSLLQAHQRDAVTLIHSWPHLEGVLIVRGP